MRNRWTWTLAAPAALLAVTACGTGGGNPTQEARDHLRTATAIAVTAHFEDPDGKLFASMLHDPNDPVPRPIALALVKGSVTLELAARNGKAVSAGARITKLSDLTRAYDVSGAVHTHGKDLFAFRIVNGTLYGASDLNLFDRLSVQAGEARPTAAAAPVARPYLAALRKGQWLQFQLGTMLDLAQGFLPPAAQHPAAYTKLVPDVLDVIGTDVGTRTVSTSGDDATVALSVPLRHIVDDVLHAMTAVLPAGSVATPAQVATSLNGRSIPATMRLTGGHVSSISVPFASLPRLDAKPDPGGPDFGKSTIVVDVDDSAPPVTAPTNVSPLSVFRLLNES